MASKRGYYKLSPELYDGVSPVYCDNGGQVLEAVNEWLMNWGHGATGHGESFTVEIVAMTEEEYKALEET